MRVNTIPVFVLFDYLKQELMTVLPPDDWRLAKDLRWRWWMLRQTIVQTNPHDQRLKQASAGAG